jgi:hypothetical protein
MIEKEKALKDSKNKHHHYGGDNYGDNIYENSLFGVDNVYGANIKNHDSNIFPSSDKFSEFLQNAFPADFKNDVNKKTNFLENYSLAFKVNIVVCGDVLINFYHIPESSLEGILLNFPVHTSVSTDNISKPTPHLPLPSPSSSSSISVTSSSANILTTKSASITNKSHENKKMPSFIKSSLISLPDSFEEDLSKSSEQIPSLSSHNDSSDITFIKIFRYSFHTGMHYPSSCISLSPSNIDSPKSILFPPNFKLITMFKPALENERSPVHYKVDWNVFCYLLVFFFCYFRFLFFFYP